MADSIARPVDRVIGGYLILAGLALAPPHTTPVGLLLLLVHLSVGTALLAGKLDPIHQFAAHATAPGTSRRRRWTGLLIDWYPLVVMPCLYLELPILNTAAWGGHYFDLMVQGWEETVFGGQPSVTMARRWPSPWVSEPLHLAYLSYFAILYVYPAVVYIRRGREAFHQTVFAMLLAFTIHYTVFVYFPVKGPYFVFPAPGEPVSDGLFYAGVHFVLGHGASAGTAFPSSHVALSAVQTGNALRQMPASAPILALATLGIAVGAVYAGVHYAVDTGLGLVTGTVLALLAPAARRWLS
ncbi:MAG: phosphatase PAP2 family protein [Longimicrobiales bacterium]